MYLRSFTKNGKKYYYIAKAIRKGNKVTQKSILYVGSADTMYKKLIMLKQKS